MPVCKTPRVLSRLTVLEYNPAIVRIVCSFFLLWLLVCPRVSSTQTLPLAPSRAGSEAKTPTERVLLKLAAGTDLAALRAKFGIDPGPELAYAPNHYVVRTASPAAAAELAAKLRRESGVLAAVPILARRLKPRFIPNDPLFTNQWHLVNTGQRGATPGVDINVTNVWETYRGRGVVVAVVDDGLLYTHPDLAANVNRELSIDVRDDDSDPAPEGEPGVDEFDEPLANSHGTAVAGIIAARGDNGIGVTGVAFEATLIAVRLLGEEVGDDQEAAALSYLPEVIEISNNSWGAIDDAQSLGGAGELALLALKHGAETGRGGKGTIYVFPAGNGGEFDDNVNYDAYASSIYTIAVGAINDRGRRASYSERGACLIVSAPGGNDAFRFQALTTTDLLGDYGFNYEGAGSRALPELSDTNYTQTFNGTSAAAPVVSGVIALMLEANRSLGWRDVQEVLMRSATKVDPENDEWVTNAAGMQFNPNLGAGLVNAEAAVALAKSWRNLDAQQSALLERTNLNVRITEEAPAEISFNSTDPNLRVEHVTVELEVSVPMRGNLEIWLESPSGTMSPLAEPHDDPNPEIAHTFSSVFNWGESSLGEWKLHLIDAAYFPPEPGMETVVNRAVLRVYGTRLSPPPAILGIAATANGIALTVSGVSGKTYDLQSTTNFLEWNVVATLQASSESFQMLDPQPAGSRRFYRVGERQ